MCNENYIQTLSEFFCCILTYPRSELWEAWKRGAQANSFAIDVENCPVACTVNHSRNSVTTTISYRYIIKEQDLSKARSVPLSTISKPYCSLTATKVEAKISHAIIHSLAHYVAIISYILTHCSKYC